ncbi:MAG: hypothetical protein IKP65_02480, partial [Alphaproteobacteria bacterium]|nr:hypothetical protein [Alphaproteobacteria bacterium]
GKKIYEKLKQELQSDNEKLQETLKKFKNYWNQIEEKIKEACNACQVACNKLSKKQTTASEKNEKEIRSKLNKTLKEIGFAIAALLLSPIALLLSPLLILIIIGNEDGGIGKGGYYHGPFSYDN